MTSSHKFLFSFLIALILLAFAATAALAQTGDGNLNLTDKLQNVGDKAGFDSPDESGLPEIIGRVVKTFLSLLGIIFMGYLVYAGSLWITARGEEEKITKAKAIIRGSIIGLVIIFAAYAITTFVVLSLVASTGLNTISGT